MKKTFREGSPTKIIQALKNLGYHQDSKGGWRRGRFHATLEIKRRKVTLNLHMDVYAYPEIQPVLPPLALSRHKAIQKGKQVTEELNRILQAPRGIRSVRSGRFFPAIAS